MNKRRFWLRVMCLVGLGMIIMAVVALGLTWKADMSGWLRKVLSAAIVYFPLSASGIVALGAFLAKSRHRRSIAVAFLLTIFGLVAISRFSGVDLGLGLMLGVYAYLAGVIATCVGAILVIVESFRSSPKIVKDSIDAAR